MVTFQGTSIQGFPRMGSHRQLKKHLEAYWSGKISRETLEDECRALRLTHWKLQEKAGLDLVCHDFSLYDHVLDTSCLLGVIPPRFQTLEPGQDLYFTMARGAQGIPPLALRKWYNTNYHYLVPEIAPDQVFTLHPGRLVAMVKEARSISPRVRLALVGPVSYLALGGIDLSKAGVLWERIGVAYGDLLAILGVQFGPIDVVMDESWLATDLPAAVLEEVSALYANLCRRTPAVSIGVNISHGQGGSALAALAALPLADLSVDMIQGKAQEDLLKEVPTWSCKNLTLGYVDGRNIWACDYEAVLGQAAHLVPHLLQRGLRSWALGTSASLLHVPFSTQSENNLDPGLKENLAFAVEKLHELAELRRLVLEYGSPWEMESWRRDSVVQSRRRIREQWATRPDIINPALRQSLESERSDLRRPPFTQRIAAFQAAVPLPVLPTTTIGSFPQTPALRSLRKAFKDGDLDATAYDAGIRGEIAHAVKVQEDLGLDVLVHGEAERNDMVEYFAEYLQGYAFTDYGWVQSYGSRCVKPPIIYGDVSRKAPMTIKHWSLAQSLTTKPMKGMLTGPVTMLTWAFPRIDLDRPAIAFQIAQAISQEIDDLVAAGAKIIQVDEAAYKEGAPLRTDERRAYEAWAAEAFRRATASAPIDVSIHTHMCYSDFTDMMPAIEAMDADVITIEAARSGPGVLEAVKAAGYPRHIGPGVYDIHSPRIPPVKEIYALIQGLLAYVDPRRLWVNPDCGLKTRRWEEVIPALVNLMEATQRVRAELRET